MVGGGLADDRAARLASAEAALNKALSLAPNHPWAHTWMGLVYLHTNRGLQSIAEADRALALDQNLAHARAGALAGAKSQSAAPRKPKGMSRRASGSRRATATPYLGDVGRSGQALSSEDEAAVAWLRRSIEANRNFRCRNSSSLRPGASRSARSRARGGAGDWHSIRRSPAAAAALYWRSIMRKRSESSTACSPSANASLRACARRASRRDE